MTLLLIMLIVISINMQLLTTSLSVRGSIPGPVKSAQCRQRSPVAIVATFLRSCVAQALSRGDEPRHSIHTLAQYREFSEDLLFYFLINIGRKYKNF